MGSPLAGSQELNIGLAFTRSNTLVGKSKRCVLSASVIQAASGPIAMRRQIFLRAIIRVVRF